MSLIDRRTLLTGLPLAASAAALPQTSAAPQRAGSLKITKLAYYRSSIRWRDLLFVEVYTDGGGNEEPPAWLLPAPVYGGATCSSSRCTPTGASSASAKAPATGAWTWSRRRCGGWNRTSSGWIRPAPKNSGSGSRTALPGGAAESSRGQRSRRSTSRFGVLRGR